MRRFLNFWRNQRGNTAVIFGLAVIPVLALGGGAVDFAQRARIKGEIQAAADTASLAAARIVQTRQLTRDSNWDDNWEEVRQNAETTARNLLTAAFKNIRAEGTPDYSIEITEELVIIHAHYDMKTSFLPVIGMNTLPAKTLAEVNLPEPILVEIALVLDYSGSMNDNGKYARMTAAAQQFIDKVSKDRGDRTKIGIVPFSEYVLATVPGGMIRGTPAVDANTPMTDLPSQSGLPLFDRGRDSVDVDPGEPLAGGCADGSQVSGVRERKSRGSRAVERLRRHQECAVGYAPDRSDQYRARVGDGIPCAHA